MRSKKERSSGGLSVTIKMKSNTENKLINFRGNLELGRVMRKMQKRQTQPCRRESKLTFSRISRITTKNWRSSRLSK